jgi:hypothetical protein
MDGQARVRPPPLDCAGDPPVGLAAAHAQQLVVLCDRDRVGLDVLHTAPRKLEVLQLLRGRLRLGHDREGDVLGGEVVRALLQPAASDLAQLAAAGRARLGLQDAQGLGLALGWGSGRRGALGVGGGAGLAARGAGTAGPAGSRSLGSTPPPPRSARRLTLSTSRPSGVYPGAITIS